MSRKRNQGRLRRLAKLNQPKPNLNFTIHQCRHGFPDAATQRHVVLCNIFIDTYIDSRKGKVPDPMGAAVEAIRQKCPELLTNETDRDSVKAILLAGGADLLKDGERDKLFIAFNIEAVLFLENYLENCDMTAREFMKCRDAIDGCDRSIIKFYAERMPCECLKKKYAIVKASQPHKMGKCAHCKERKERRQLLLCSGCNRQQYCSMKCQASQWPDHKEKCMNYWEDKEEETFTH